MKKVLAVVIAVSVALVLMVTPVMAAKNVVLCRVDIGSETASQWAGMSSWGPIEPATHGGNWGGFGASGEDCRVIWHSVDSDPSATITLGRGVRPGAAKAIEVRHLDGLADDSFDISVKDVHGNWVQIGSYTWSGNTNEFWVTSTFSLPNGKTLQLDRGRDVEVKLDATGPQWSGFNTYGQVAFDWIELVGNGKK